MRRFIPAALAVLFMLAVSGCTKRIPVEDGVYDARHTFVITFKDGSTIKGKIGLNEDVEVATGGKIYGGSILDMTAEEIYVEECRLIRSVEDGQAEAIRMAAARHNLEETPGEFVFELSEIDRVDQVKVDPLRTATRSAFWTLTGIVSAFLLSEKS